VVVERRPDHRAFDDSRMAPRYLLSASDDFVQWTRFDTRTGQRMWTKPVPAAAECHGGSFAVTLPFLRWPSAAQPIRCHSCDSHESIPRQAKDVGKQTWPTDPTASVSTAQTAWPDADSPTARGTALMTTKP
jgi:hypothetical protein